MMEQPACYDLEEAREDFAYLMSPLVLVSSQMYNLTFRPQFCGTY